MISERGQSAGLADETGEKRKNRSFYLLAAPVPARAKRNSIFLDLNLFLSANIFKMLTMCRAIAAIRRDSAATLISALNSLDSQCFNNTLAAHTV